MRCSPIWQARIIHSMQVAVSIFKDLYSAGVQQKQSPLKFNVYFV
jgi:hypothetical protein